jgi:2-oxo-4-hydroxy-4-carboxy-5-ureidoimidazoline decarboxylase
MTDALIEVAAFDALSPAAAAALLRPACASTGWVSALVTGRPYADVTGVIARSDAVIAGLDTVGVDEALAAHPRIGERAAGAGREAVWSRQEQAGVPTSDAAAGLAAGNAAYEQRFGRVFLICASGRTSAELLAALTERLGHDAATEERVVRQELASIVRLRLAKTLR